MSPQNFDPNAAATADSGIFGLPTEEKEASLVFLPVPWEATTSYGGGTSDGPAAIFDASRQVDLYDLEVLRPYEAGLFMREEVEEVRSWAEEARELAQGIIAAGGRIEGDATLARSLKRVNELGVKLNEWVRAETRSILAAGKIPAIVGGDHSVPFGAIQAMAEKERDLGILHFDAHSDTRNAFEGFHWSHASIMRNVLEQVPGVTRLVQVGIRDFCEEEVDYCASQGSRVAIHFDSALAQARFQGKTWDSLTDAILAPLPEKVWISFDIDGLDPRFCPHTGTPVPGGLDFNEACYLIGKLARSGRKIVGFDLNEVAPNPQETDEWDANVGARLLYKMTAFCLASQGKARFQNGAAR